METQFTPPIGNTYREGSIVTATPNESAVAWCAVFAGAVASAALSLILLLLGTGFGLTLVSPWANEGISGTSFGVTSILGITLISILASALGGYIAGRLRTRWSNTANDEVYFRDTAHGFLSWAVATLVTATLLTSVISGIIGGGIKAGAAVVGGAASAVAGAATTVAAQSADDEMNSDGADNLPMSYLLDSLLRKNTSAPVVNNPQPTMNPENPEANPENPQAPVDTTAPAPAAATTPPPVEATNSAPQTMPKSELARIFINAIKTGSLPEQDVQYAGQLVAQYTDMDQQTAEQRVTETFTKLQASLREAETAALEAADKAREVSAHTSLWLFISLLCGAFVASLMAVYGGRQRDL